MQYLQYLSIFLIIVGGLFLLIGMFSPKGMFTSKKKPRYDSNRPLISVTPKIEKPPVIEKTSNSFDSNNLEKFNSFNNFNNSDNIIETKPLETSQIKEKEVIILNYNSDNLDTSLKKLDGEVRQNEVEQVYDSKKDELDNRVHQNEVPPPKELILSEKTVLYNDDSGLVDYFAETSVFDYSFSRYKRIKRLAEGCALIEGNGVSLRSPQGFFRFTFDALEKAAFGKNYAALFIKGAESVKLLLFGQNADAVPLLEKVYNSYLSERIK